MGERGRYLPECPEMSEVVRKLTEEYGGHVIFSRESEVYVEVPRHELRDVAKYLYNSGAFLKTCAAVDERPLNRSFALYHIFGMDSKGYDVIVKVSAPEDDAWVPSIVDVVPAADWCELEARDMVGIELKGRRLVRRLVLPEDWPEDVHPLRKEVPHDFRPPSVKAESEFRPPERGIPIGPYHPVLHEPEYFELLVEGETVVDVYYRGFHVHRGIEKLGESPRFTYQKIPFLAERICGICGFVHSTCAIMAMEKAAGIRPPERAEFIRTVVLELERIHSHLLWVGVAAHILGYDAGFMHTWRVREPVMILSELITGSRKTYGLNLVGGVRRDIDKDKMEKIMKTLERVEKGFKELANLLVSVPQIRRRAQGTGVLTRSEARALSVVGPVARASGLYRDVRKDYPYLAYKEASFKVPLYTEGDNLARVLVRVEEVFESISIIKQLLDKLPGGPIMHEKCSAIIPVDELIPPGKYAVAAIEAPRGEDVHFLMTGEGRPYRWRVRAPTYQNIPALRPMLRGDPLADAPLTIASIDPCFSCTDRALVIDVRTGRARTIKLWDGGVGTCRL